MAQSFNKDALNSMSDMFQNMMNGQVPMMDKEAAMQHYRKNLEILTQANSMAADVMKSISQMQSDFLRKAFEEMTRYAQDYARKMNRDDYMDQNNKFKNQMNQWVEHNNKIANVLAQSNRQFYDVFQQKVQQGMDEMKQASTDRRSKK